MAEVSAPDESREADASVPASSTARLSQEFPAKILIADDDPSIRRMLGVKFRKRAEVVEAGDGAQAVQLLYSEQPEFVVTDLWMPNLDGLGLLKEVRRSFVGAGVPVLMLTSENEEEALHEAFWNGADDYQKKPFSIQELMLRISAIHVRQRMARDVNPLTRLPGNLMLKREIESRIRNPEVTAIAYVDLDHFKSFNDYQGFDRGDHVIELMSNILKEFACGLEPGEVFVGHVGGDDFVVLMPPSAIDSLHQQIDTKFAEATRLLYSPEEWQRGYYEAHNRAGELQRFELLSASIGVLTTERRGMDDLRRIAAVAAEVKKMAKAIPGNSLFVDRRTE